MDEFNQHFTIDDLIIKENIEIKSIHLLSENDKYILAISWFESGETHFKMFKNQSRLDLKIFNNFLLEYNKYWNELVLKWISKPTIPLHLKPF